MKPLPGRSFDNSTSLSRQVYEHLHQRICAFELKPYQALSEKTIAEEMGVSRTPVREALAQLEQDGLVQQVAPRGFAVFQVSLAEFREICDCRTVLETAAFCMSVEADRDAFADRLAAIGAAMTARRRAGDTLGYLALDQAFHDAFFADCGNRFLGAAYQTIRWRMMALRGRMGTDPDHLEKSWREHLELARLARQNDIPRAKAILDAHIGRKEGSYWTHMR